MSGSFVRRPPKAVVETANIRVHLGKIKVWNSSGVRPRACDTLQDIATASGSLDQVWKGSDLPTDQQGIKVLGTLLGHRDFVAAHLARVLRSHETLLERIPAVQDVQCAWALLLHSAASRANYQLRVVRPELTEGFARGHDEGHLTRCLCRCEITMAKGISYVTRPHYPLHLEGWGCAAHTVLGSQVTGRVGQTRSPWSEPGIRQLQLHSSSF